MNARSGNTVWHLNIDRVVVVGVAGAMPGAVELRGLIESHVAGAAASAQLPPGLTMRASVQLDARALSGSDAVARAVASGVSQALGGGRSRA